MSGPIEARCKALRSHMVAHVFMCMVGGLGIGASLYSMTTPSLWAAMCFAINVVLLRLNVGRYLVLMRKRQELIAILAVMHEVAQQIKAQKEQSNG